MVVRIHNPSKWRRVDAGQVLHLPGDHSRKFRIEVNAPSHCRVDLMTRDEKVACFLAAFSGLETLEFTAEGDVYLAFSGPDEVWFSTLDGEPIGYDAVAASFTKPMQRKSRNPDLERMMWKLRENAERREAAMRSEFAAMLAARPPHNPETGEVEEDVPSSTAPEPSIDAPAAPAAGGKKSGAKAGVSPAPAEGLDDGAGT